MAALLGTPATRLRKRALSPSEAGALRALDTALDEAGIAQYGPPRALAQSLRVGSTRGFLTEEATERLGRFVTRALAEPLPGTVGADATREERLLALVPQAVAAIKAKAPIESGALVESIEAGPNGVRPAEDGSEGLWAQSPLLYPRIQDLGGLAGKNHTSLLAGHYYLAKASAEVGVPISWAPNQAP